MNLHLCNFRHDGGYSLAFITTPHLLRLAIYSQLLEVFPVASKVIVDKLWGEEALEMLWINTTRLQANSWDKTGC